MIDLHNKALKEENSFYLLNNDKWINAAKIYEQLGNNYLTNNNNESAYQCYMKSIEYYKLEKYYDHVINLYLKISNITDNVGDIIQIYMQCISLTDDFYTIGLYYNRLAERLLRLKEKDYVLVSTYFYKSYQYYDISDFPHKAYKSLYKYIKCLIYLDKIEIAIYKLKKLVDKCNMYSVLLLLLYIYNEKYNLAKELDNSLPFYNLITSLQNNDIDDYNNKLSLNLDNIKKYENYDDIYNYILSKITEKIFIKTYISNYIKSII